MLAAYGGRAIKSEHAAAPRRGWKSRVGRCCSSLGTRPQLSQRTHRVRRCAIARCGGLGLNHGAEAACCPAAIQPGTKLRCPGALTQRLWAAIRRSRAVGLRARRWHARMLKVAATAGGGEALSLGLLQGQGPSGGRPGGRLGGRVGRQGTALSVLGPLKVCTLERYDVMTWFCARRLGNVVWRTDQPWGGRLLIK